MNRIFHTRIVWYHYVMLILLTIVMLWCFWIQNAIVVIFMVTTVILIEKIIHTTYTVTTDGKLIVYKGRFSKKKIIDIKEIKTTKECHSMNFRNIHLMEYVLIQYGNEKYISLEPVKRQEFIELINKVKTKIEANN